MKKIIHYALILDKSGSMKHIEKEVVSSFNEQVLIAIFTDGLENASSDYTASDIRKELAQAEEKGWQVKFFCPPGR